MTKRKEELQNLVSGLVEQKSKLEAQASAYTTLSKSKNKYLRSAALQHFQSNLKLVVSNTQQCLEYIDKHNDSLSKKTKMQAMKVIGGVLENFDGYATLQSQSSSVPKQSYNDYFALLDKFLKLHEALTNEKNVILFQGDGTEKILFKNLKSQIAYINKLNNNPDNFLPENIKKTRMRADNIALILNELVSNVEKSSDKKIFEGLLAEAFNDLKKLGVKIMMHEPDDLSEKDKPSQKTEQGLESALKSTAKEHAKMLKKLRTFNSSLIYKYYASGTPKASEKLDITISEIKSELLNESFPNLLTNLHKVLDNAIDKAEVNDITETRNTYQKIRESLGTMLKDSQKLFNTPAVYRHNDIEDTLTGAYQDLYVKLKELEAFIAQQPQKVSTPSPEVRSWAKNPQVKPAEPSDRSVKQDELDSPKGTLDK